MQRMVSDRLSGMAASCGRAMRARIILRRAKQDTEIAEMAGPAVPRLARYAPHLRLGRNASPVRAASLFEAAGRESARPPARCALLPACQCRAKSAGRSAHRAGGRAL